jgi:peroxiredoxin
MKHISAAACGSLLMLVAAACSNNEWHIKGSLEGGEGKEILVQASDNGRWYTLDTITAGKDGKFDYSHPAMGRPDIYRLSLNGRNIYFPIDSIETITVTANDSTFDTSYTIAGTPNADALMMVDTKLREAVSAHGIYAAANDSVMKRELAQTILSDPAGIVAYYIISKQINGQYLFNPAVRSDNRIIGAVANAYNEQRPNDPRTAYIKQIYLANRAAMMPTHALPTDTIQAAELAYFDIALTNQKGDTLTLSKTVNNNKVVVLSFTAYTADGSTAYNAQLADAYRRYHSQGLEIYQIAFDDDEFQWKKSANNLPWITVYHPATQGIQLLQSYNVQGLPTTFVIANGQITDRITDPNKITSTIARHI